MNAIQEDIKKLCNEGVIGFFKRLEVVTVFGIDKDSKQVFNVITVIVAVEHIADIKKNIEYLSDSLINVKGTTIAFGVMRYYIAFDSFYESITELKEKEIWNASGNDLATGKIEEVGKNFVPSDAAVGVQLNNILKNNLFGGSYIYEWFDINKNYLNFLFEKPSILQELSSKISQYIPLKIASLSDRLGNFILQLPISIIYSKVTHKEVDDGLALDVYWHTQAEKYKRKLQFVLITENDSIYPDFHSFEVNEGKYLINMQHNDFSHRYFIWDELNGNLLLASTISGFISSFNINGGMLESEPRVFSTIDKEVAHQRINMRTPWESSFTTNAKNTEVIKNIQNARIFNKEKDDLLRRKEFIQYHKDDESRALADLRYLINEYGEKGVWLWDPYLSSNDILNTLFFCEHSNTELKAITLLNHNESKCPMSCNKCDKVLATNNNKIKRELIEIYKSDLDKNSGNKQGLNLEFRSRYGKHGWSFHDRFIVFPDTSQGTLAWSLGTSVNSLGQSHHIFQKVSHAQLIADAFDELWQELNVEECLVWKS